MIETVLIVVSLLLAGGCAYWLVLVPWFNRWGATDEEAKRGLPGDEIAPRPRKASTRAITIRASPGQVWPWIVQIGQGRGGLYSYERIENLFGCDIHNTDRIHPEWQDLQAGDIVRLGPEGYPSYPVAAVEAGQALILGGHDPRAGSQSWVFYLEEVEAGQTRLIVRSRSEYPPTVANFILWRVITEPIHFIMERKMLYGIRQRAERWALHSAAAAT